MEDLVSFKGCPYNCQKGIIFDPYTHTKRLCPHCEELRKKEAAGAKEEYGGRDIRQKLNLPQSYVASEYKFENFMPRNYKEKFTEETIHELQTEIDKLFVTLACGDVPEYSVLFNVQPSCYIQNLLYPLLIRAYVKGLDPLPLLSCYDISRAKRAILNTRDNYNRLTYDDMVSNKFCVVLMEESVSSYTLDLKGLMQLRALRGLATVIIKYSWSHDISALMSHNSLDTLASAKIVYLKEIPNKTLDVAGLRVYLKDNSITTQDISAVGLDLSAFNEAKLKILETTVNMFSTRDFTADVITKLEKLYNNKKTQKQNNSKQTYYTQNTTPNIGRGISSSQLDKLRSGGGQYI